MTKAEAKKRINIAVRELNNMHHKLKFSFVESEYSWSLKAENSQGGRFGAYEPRVLFDCYRRKTDAYIAFVQQVEFILAGTNLMNPAAYHNMY